MFSLRKVGGVYHYDIHFKGERYRGSTKADNKDLAKIVAKKIYDDIHARGFGIKKPIYSCSDFVESYLKEQCGNMSKEWAYTTKKLLEKFLRFLDQEGIKNISDVDVGVVEKYKSVLLGQMVPVSVKNNMRVLSAMFNRGTKLKLLHENPVRLTTPIRGIERNKQRYLTNDEIALVSDACAGTWLYDLVLVALHTGMRRKELIFLECGDIDLNNNLIYVRNKASIGFQTKSRKERTIPIHDKILPLLTALKKKSGGFVFVDKDGIKLTERKLTETFTGITKSIGLAGVGLHTLRHTFASHLAMNGVSLWEIAKLMGHSSTHVTELYSHLCPARREIEKLNF